MRVCSSFIDLRAAVQFSQHHLLKRLRLSFFFVFFLFFFSFLFRATPMAYRIPRLRVELELPPAYSTATEMPDPSRVCDVHHSSQPPRIFNLLIKARNRTCVLMDTSQICFCWATMGTQKRLSFSCIVFLPPLSKINRCLGLFLDSLSCSIGLYVCFGTSTTVFGLL